MKYDSRNPSRAVIDSSVQSGRIFMVICIVIASMGILGCSYAFWMISQCRTCDGPGPNSSPNGASGPTTPDGQRT